MLKSLFIFLIAANAYLLILAETPEENDHGEECDDSPPTSPENVPTTCPEGVDKLLEDGNAIITGKFLYEAVKTAPNESLIMSAFSTLTPFSQLALYAQGDTLDQFLKALNLPDKQSIRCVFLKLISSLRAEENIILNIANRIYATDRFPLSTNFVEDTKQIFDAEAENADFLDGQDTADKINKWVAEQTNNRIRDLAKADMFNEDTRLVLANAIYFLGNWISQFNEENTSNSTFYVNKDTSVEIPTMLQQNKFKYGESDKLDCKILEMFYKGGNFSFVVFLPNQIDGLFSMVEKLQDAKKFYEAYDNTVNEEVEVHLPKMKIESEFDLIPLMVLIGLTDVLNRFKSNLAGILKEHEQLYVSVAKQKSFCEVDEKGTEAAAANVVGVVVPVSMPILPEVRVFQADHPFAYYILHKRNIIFSGVFAKK